MGSVPLSSCPSLITKIRGKLTRIVKIQELLIWQCLAFFGVVVLSLGWLWRYLFFETITITYRPTFVAIIAVFTVSQIVHIVAFYKSYKEKWSSKIISIISFFYKFIQNDQIVVDDSRQYEREAREHNRE